MVSFLSDEKALMLGRESKLSLAETKLKEFWARGIRERAVRVRRVR